MSQAFVAGVFQRVIDGQNQVSWSPQAFAEDASLSRWATIGYTALTLLVMAMIGAGYLLYKKSKIG